MLLHEKLVLLLLLFGLTFYSDHATPVRCFCTVFLTHIQVKSLSLYVVFPCLGESRKLKQLVNIRKITENILQQCSVLNILRLCICHGKLIFPLGQMMVARVLTVQGDMWSGFRWHIWKRQHSDPCFQ